MSAEYTSERPKDKFGIVNHYSPDVFYALLTRDHLPHKYPLLNNFNEIRVEGYDPAYDLCAGIEGKVAAVYDASIEDRNRKVFDIHADFRWRLIPRIRDVTGYIESSSEDESKRVAQLSLLEKCLTANSWLTEATAWYSKLSFNRDKFEENKFNNYRLNVQEELDKSGLLFDLLSNYGGSVDQKQFYFVSTDLIPKIKIDFNYRVASVGTDCDCLIGVGNRGRELLVDESQFGNVWDRFFGTVDKLIRVVYKVTEKDLPPVKLVFKPEEKGQKEFLAACSFCGSNYFTAKGLECPHCGASSPQFLMEK